MFGLLRYIVQYRDLQSLFCRQMSKHGVWVNKVKAVWCRNTSVKVTLLVHVTEYPPVHDNPAHRYITLSSCLR